MYKRFHGFFQVQKVQLSLNVRSWFHSIRIQSFNIQADTEHFTRKITLSSLLNKCKKQNKAGTQNMKARMWAKSVLF